MVVHKILLSVPNFKWSAFDSNTLWHYIPYNLCLLASVLEPKFEVQIIDANMLDMTEADFAKYIVSSSPDVVGITAMMDKYGSSAHRVAKIVKDVSKNIITVMGGVYATTNPQLVMKDENCDYVVVGEGEFAFRELLKHIAGDASLPQGVWYRNPDGVIVANGRVPFIEDLDIIPLPAYHLIDFNSYAHNVSRNSVDRPPALPFARINTSRGCPHDCCFCQVESISGRKFRPRSAENVLEEIEQLYKVYSINSFIIDDDNFLTNRKRALAIFDGLIKSGMNLPWKSIATAAFYLDDEIIESMARSGCQYIDVAIESGVERVLKQIINKPLKLDHACEVVKKAKSEGIFVAANFIIGFPGETWDEIRETLQFAEELDADYIKIFTATPLPNTRLMKMTVESNFLIDGYDSLDIDWNRGWIETNNFRAKDLTILRAYEWDRINFTKQEKRKKVMEMLDITEGDLLKMRRETLGRIELNNY